jgi:hypothetical protein
MSAIELRKSLHWMIEHESNEQVLYQIKILLEQNRNIQNDELGGQTIDEFNREMDESEAEIDKGIFATQEEVTVRFEQIFKK